MRPADRLLEPDHSLHSVQVHRSSSTAQLSGRRARDPLHPDMHQVTELTHLSCTKRCTRVGGKSDIFVETNNSLFEAAVDVNNCLERFKLPKSLYTSAPILMTFKYLGQTLLNPKFGNSRAPLIEIY